MASEITVEIAGRIGEAQIGEMIRTVTLAFATQVQAKLNEDKPPPPALGSMKFKSVKQKRFVMAAYSRGEITVPYKRGTGSGLRGSETLNRSYSITLNGDDAILTSAASYAPYVVGDQQADIHKGRWNTAMNAADQVSASGDLDYIVQKAMEAL
jgi:hypothetical protein